MNCRILPRIICPGQIQYAVNLGVNTVVYASEAVAAGLAQGDGTQPASNFLDSWGALNAAQFVASAAAATAIDPTHITGTLNAWIRYFTTQVPPPSGYTILQAAELYALGDTIGESIFLQQPINGQANALYNQAFNALVNNAEVIAGVAGAQYLTGQALNVQPQHIPLQGESIPFNSFLTTGVDTPNTGFANAAGTPNNPPGFTATLPNTVFFANPDTITPGDNLVANASATNTGLGGVGTPAPGTGPGGGVGSALLSGFTVGVNTSNLVYANLQNTVAGESGFQGVDTGILTVSNQNSVGFVRLGAPGQGLGTVLQTYNSNNAVSGFAAYVAPSAFSATDNTITANFTGPLGSVGDPSTNVGPSNAKLIFAPASGTAGYITENINTTDNVFLRLAQGNTGVTEGGGGFGSVQNLNLGGAGNIELNAINPGDFASLLKVDATGSTATGTVVSIFEPANVVITGATANKAGGYYSSNASSLPVGNPPSEAGLITSGGGHTIALTSFLGAPTGANFVDLSAMTGAAINAMTALTGNTAAGVTNTLILPHSVVTQAAALTPDSGFQIIGDPSWSGGTFDNANFKDATELKLYGTVAAGAPTLTVANGSDKFVLDVSGDTSAVAVPPALPPLVTNPLGAVTLTAADFGPQVGQETATVILGNDNHVNADGVTNHTFDPVAVNDAIGALQTFGYETNGSTAGLTIQSTGQITDALGDGHHNITGAITETPDVGAGASLTVQGHTSLDTLGAVQLLGFAGGLLTVTDTGSQLGLSHTDVAGGGVSYEFGSATEVLVGGVVTSYAAGTATNASLILASASGGIIMNGPDTASISGATIRGSDTGPNWIDGSQGADNISVGTGASVIATGLGTGGTHGDTVTLAAGHPTDHIEIYTSVFDPEVTDVGPPTNNPGLYEAQTGSQVSATDLAQGGAWGLAFGAAPVQGGVVNASVVAGGTGGTSLSMVQIDGWQGGDILDLSGGTDVTVLGSAVTIGSAIDFAATNNPQGGLAFGLTEGFNGTLHVAGTIPGAPATINAGGYAPTAAFGADSVLFVQGTFFDANALASFLHTNSFTLNGAGLAANEDAHAYVLYNDTTNSARIADVDIGNFAAPTTHTNDAGSFIIASDLVQIVGTQAATIASAGGAAVHITV